MRISPREQVNFLARLHRGDLPFSTATLRTVREMTLDERTDTYALHAKTGWAGLPESENVGWWVGWVEDASGVHFLATALEATAPDASSGRARAEVTRRVLGRLGLVEAATPGTQPWRSAGNDRGHRG